MERSVVVRMWGLSLVLLLSLGCNEDTLPDECELTYSLLSYLRIDTVQHPSVVVDGTRFNIRGESFLTDPNCITPQVALVDGTNEILLTATLESTNEITAVMPAGSVASLGGVGSFSGVLEVRFEAIHSNNTFSASHQVTFDFVEDTTPAATSLGQNEAYLNDEMILNGSNFLDGADEGVTEIILDGTYEGDNGARTTVSNVSLNSVNLATYTRSSVTFLWSPLIAGVRPGTFRGTITPQNRHANGNITRGSALSVEVSQRDTVVFGISPDTVSLGQIVDIVGRGFIGDPESEEELGTTSFRLYGEFTPCTANLGLPLNCDNDPILIEGTTELIGRWVSGELVRYPVTVSNSGNMLHATDLGAQRGTFEGSIVPVLTLGTKTHEGIPIPDITLVLGPVRQIAWVVFLPGFSSSLDLFGLGAVENEIRSRVIERMQEIYQPPDDETRRINVEFRSEEPEDFYVGGYAILEIGGPDLNAIGLFGYDNTPGKDIGNLRLADYVGGRNALGELDGYGYGGVFVESMLFWSEHPPKVLGERPRGAPPATPVFDEYFDPVRDAEVVAGEYPDGTDPERIAEIDAAISFLSNMIADTAAHEFGHSLGLAQPFVPDAAYHNAIPQPYCLMDSGGDRPIEERARLQGNEGARFCQENLWYLQDILPMQ